MKDIALSLLSRGCGHVVQSQLGSKDGRLEDYFEPKVKFQVLLHLIQSESKL